MSTDPPYVRLRSLSCGSGADALDEAAAERTKDGLLQHRGEPSGLLEGSRVQRAAAKTMNTTTVTQDVCAMPFGQKGLMGGLGLDGSKISPLKD
jgi:hypothetical protein